ncbi:RNA-directed DNA polymerase-like protein [Gossypium australe]|uniref:RNA-directed DNA polymerase-like protein n=1 Tax=Gossypium australe TaxID=47621 RepID=A0A5B6WSB5_9ROSI|nr:RNA-directed DNA polymerase-like protein [Gossypium australe]
MRVNDQQITFNIFDAMKCVDENEECQAIGFLGSAVEEEFAKLCHNNSDDDRDPFELAEVELIGELGGVMETKQFECRPSIEDPHTLELKPLPLHLKYNYQFRESLVQCVPKKGGVTVVSNDNNELIPTHTITG